MSRVESPFHAIAAEALDDKDTPDVRLLEEVEADGSSAPATATTVATSSVEAKDSQEEDSAVKPPALEANTENDDDGEHFREENGGENENGVEANGGNEASVENGGPEHEAEETPVALELKISAEGGGAEVSEIVTKKSKKRTNVWTKTTSRKSAKKVKSSGVRGQSDAKDDNVLLKPFHQEDNPSYPILLSKIYKAEKIELSADRLSASGSKGYRMVRATRGVAEGAWYFEICVERLGATGHTRLGWSTRRGDLQAPVGYDAHSYSYRDLDGCKVHAALREDHGEAYHEKDVIGFYINLPREPGFTWKQEEEVVGYKGQPYIIVAEEPLKPLPGSEILFFKNGVCQDVAFKDINDGSYFPAASMYTLPSQDCCKVVFNFGPDFRYPVTDLGVRPLPSPMCQAPGPSGEAKAETFPTNQSEAVVQFTENGGDKWMAPELGDPMEVEEATEATRKESKPKEVEKVPSVAKKKVKKPIGTGTETGLALKAIKKDLPGSGSALKASKKDLHGTGKALNSSKDVPGTGLIHKPSKKDSPGADSALKARKKDSHGTGFKPRKDVPATGLIHKPSKKDLLGIGSALKESKKDSHGTGLALKSSKDYPATGLIHKLSKKDLLGTGSAHKPSKNDLPRTGSVHKPDKKDLPGTGSADKPGKKDLAGTGSVHKSSKDLSVTGSAGKPGKKNLPGTGSAHKSSKDFPRVGSADKPSKKDFPGTGSTHRPSKKDLPGTGSAHRPSKKDLPGTGSAHGPSKKDLPGTGSAYRPSKKDLPGTGSVHKLSDFNGPGSLPRGMGPSGFGAGRNWGGIHGALNVDVVVVETSTPSQAEGPFR